MSIDRNKGEKEVTAAILLVLLAMQDTFDWYGRGGSWQEFENQIVTALEEPLAKTYRDSATDLADRYKAAEPGAYGEGAEQWAGQRAREIAASMRAGTEKRVEAARERSTPETFKDELSGIFNRSRAESVAVTEITVSITAGERDAAKRLEDEENLLMVAVWRTEQDSSVCPVCRPMHGKPESEWPEALRDGPPAHPNCRCQIEWRPTKIPNPKAA